MPLTQAVGWLGTYPGCVVAAVHIRGQVSTEGASGILIRAVQAQVVSWLISGLMIRRSQDALLETWIVLGLLRL